MRALALLVVAACTAPAIAPSERPVVRVRPAYEPAYVSNRAWTWSWSPDEDRSSYREACGETPVARAAVSPLVRFRTSAWSTRSGFVIVLSPLAGTADELLAAVRCHRAWLAAAEIDGPLAIPGLVVDARGDRDAITLALRVRDPARVRELQRSDARLGDGRELAGHDGE